MSRRKSTMRVKLKATSQENFRNKKISRIYTETFLKSLKKNKKNINQVDIKLVQFMGEELRAILKKKMKSCRL